MSILNKIISNLWVIRYIIPIVYFNFHYLPFKVAIKLPIFLYKPRLVCCKGKIIISGGVKTGMIKLGRNRVSLYPDGGISWENKGVVEFKGECYIGRNSFISTGKNGYIIFGEDFVSTNSFKIVSYHMIKFGNHVLCGWECTFIDTDFHKLTFEETINISKPYGSIEVGDNCWFGFKSIALKNTKLPTHSVVASNSLLNQAYNIPPKSLLAGIPAKLIKTGVYRNFNNDKIEYTNE